MEELPSSEQRRLELAVPANARAMAGSAAVLYLLGGFLALVSAPIGGSVLERGPIIGVGLAAITTGALLHLLHRRLPLIAYQLLTAFAAVLITFAVHVGGSTAPAFTFFYVWVAAWSFYWLTPRMAWLEMAWMGMVAAVQILGRRPAGAQSVELEIFYWATMVVTACSTGLLLTYLAGRRARDHDQLTWRRQQLDDVMAGLPLSVFALDARGTLLVVEGRALDRLEMPAGGLLGRSVFDLLPGTHPFRGAAERALAGEDVAGSVELGDGEYEYRLTPMHGAEGALRRVSGTIVDVTEPRRHEREAMERRAREMFTAKVSHELRTPLNAMLGFLQLLQGRGGDGLSDRQRGHLERVETAARMQLDLVNDLLDLQKLRSGEPHFDIEIAAVDSLLEDVVEMVGPVADAKGVRLVTDLAHIRLATDRRRLSQAVLNLLSNSIKFSPPGEQVVLRALASADRLVIEVVDHGPGLAEEHLERVFDEFYQVPSATAAQGTGLGLAITRQVVRALGGDVTVESKPGEGARFAIELPVRPVVADAQALAGAVRAG